VPVPGWVASGLFMVVTLLTDFGTRDSYVGAMKGVILGLAPGARLVDLTHSVPPQAVIPGALILRNAVPVFPSGTVHVAVVDPGVGSERAPIAVFAGDQVLVGPDNGLLHPAAGRLGLREIRRLECEALFRRPVSRTFHGRDVFAPVAAHLVAGIEPERLGPVVPSMEPLSLPECRVDAGEISGEVIYIDRFGNLITNIPGALLAEAGATARFAGGPRLPVADTYSQVASGEPLALVGSWEQLEIAVRDGSAARDLGGEVGSPVTVGRGGA